MVPYGKLKGGYDEVVAEVVKKAKQTIKSKAERIRLACRQVDVIIFGLLVTRALRSGNICGLKFGRNIFTTETGYNLHFPSAEMKGHRKFETSCPPELVPVLNDYINNGYVNLADRLQVETAMWESIRGDTLKRTLIIDGPTRLIRMSEQRNDGLDRFKGTSVTLYLARGSGNDKNQPPQWHQIKDYLIDICQDLPYRLNLEHISSDGHVTRDFIAPIQLTVQLPERLEPLSVRIPVNDQESGLEGEIALVNPYLARKLEQKLSEGSPISIQSEASQSESTLLRGGFKIGQVPGLPDSWVARLISTARLRFNWKCDSNRRYPMPNLARNRAADSQLLSQNVLRIWLDYLLSNVDSLPEGLLYYLEASPQAISNGTWLERYDTLTIYNFARQGWRFVIGDEPDNALQTWESCTGESLCLGSSFRTELYWQLLDMILPKITTLQMKRGIYFYVKPPKPGWRKILEGWQNYMTSPIRWGPFVEYIGDIENLLAYEYPGSAQFNSRFRKRLLKSFSENELHPLLKVLHVRRQHK